MSDAEKGIPGADLRVIDENKAINSDGSSGNSINPYGEAPQSKSQDGVDVEVTKEKNEDKTKEAKPEEKASPTPEAIKDNATASDPTPPPPENMLTIDTSGMYDMFTKIVARLEGHDRQNSALESALQQANEESAARISSLEATIQSQAETVAALTTELAEQQTRNSDLAATMSSSSGDLEASESGRAVLARLMALESASVESGKAATLVNEMSIHLAELQETVVGKHGGLGHGLSTLRSRLAKVELSFTQRIGPLVNEEGSEKARKLWKANKATLMMSAQLGAKHKADLAAQQNALIEAERKLEEQEAREATEGTEGSKEGEEAEGEEEREARIEKEKLEKEAILKEMAEMKAKIKESQARISVPCPFVPPLDPPLVPPLSLPRPSKGR